MNLCFTLPEPERQSLDAHVGKQKPIYCVPFDLDTEGMWCCDGWVVVTGQQVVLIKNHQVEKAVAIEDCEKAECLKQEGCGILMLRTSGEDRIFARFSMAFLPRFSYLAKGIRLLRQGEEKTVQSREAERICPKCGRVLPGTAVCPRCSGSGRFTHRMGELMRPYAWKFFGVALLMLAATGLSLYQAQYQREFIDNVVLPESGGLSEIIGFGVIMLLIVALSLISNILKNRWTVILGSKISMDIREKLYVKIQELSLSFIDKRSAGELIGRITGDTTHIKNFMQQVFSGLISQIVTMVCVFIVMLVMNWQVALMALAMVPVIIVVTFVFRKKTRRLYRRQGRYEDITNSQLQDTLSGIRVVKSFGKEASEIKKFEQLNLKLADTQAYNEVFWATFFPFITFSIGLGTYIITYFGGLNVLGGSLTVGQLTQFISYAGMLYAPLQRMAFLPRMLSRTITSLERVYDVLDEETEVPQSRHPVELSIKGAVELEHISFGYLSYDPVLEDISLSVKPGEMIGIVGSSGAGKSTLINLIMRLYDPDDGRITVDGVDLKEIAHDSLYSQLGVVLQETFLFSGTILANLRFAKPDATMEEVIQAAKIGGAHDFICKLPDGYNTYVGESGNTLSGGERQRIAIARAVLGDPRILILDEATSSLDTETEYQIQEALGRLIQGRTTFAIAHRLSTLRNADRILVIDKKRVAEVGTHEELMKKKGIYYHLVTTQLAMNNQLVPPPPGPGGRGPGGPPPGGMFH